MRPQRGVALITAMLVMALITTLTFGLEWDNSMDLRRTYVSMYRDEAIQAAYGAESWVLTILRQDSQDSTTDHLGEIWASELPVLPLGGPGDSIQGEIYGQIEDLQGRFNINNLVDAQGEVDQPSLEQFQRLLLALGLDPRFAGIAADWIDADQDPGFPDGAEDSIYTGLVPPYRAANQIISSPSELAALEGMDKATLDVLLPHITALPGRTAINVNTATGPVLQSLDENLSVADVEGLLAQRQDTGFGDVTATWEGEEGVTYYLAVDGTATGVRCPLRYSFAREIASIRSILRRSPGLRGMRDGATTSHENPSWFSVRCRTYPTTLSGWSWYSGIRLNISASGSAVAAFFGGMVGLCLQQRHGAFGEIVIFVYAGAVLLVAAVKELATIAPLSGLEDDKMAAVGLPDENWAGRQFAVGRIQADFRIGILQIDIATVALFQRGLDDPILSFCDIWDSAHAT